MLAVAASQQMYVIFQIEQRESYIVDYLYYTGCRLEKQSNASSKLCPGESATLIREYSGTLASLGSIFVATTVLWNKQMSIANTYWNTATQTKFIYSKQLAEQYRAQKRGLMQKLLTGKQRIQNG